ncbi:MAG: hypothetical protein U1G07_22125 [Verrucomicrobiota bacterium]
MTAPPWLDSFNPRSILPLITLFDGQKAGNAKDLGTLGPVSDLTYNSVATDVSSDGAVVVGYSRRPRVLQGRRSSAFRWTQAGGLVDLDRPRASGVLARF